MTPTDALVDIIIPTLGDLDIVFNSREAALMLLAIGMQESGFRTRFQYGGGPAHGFWQCEPGTMGGIQRFLDHGDVRLKNYVVKQGFPLQKTLYYSIATPSGDKVACCIARGLLWMYPDALPQERDEEEAWKQYVKQWGPGAVTHGGPRAIQARKDWSKNYWIAYNAIEHGGI